MKRLNENDFYQLAPYTLHNIVGKKVYNGRLGSYHAKWNGEYRTPKKGEWFLSGAEIEAYYNYNDLDTPYHIANIFMTEQVTVRQIVEKVS